MPTSSPRRPSAKLLTPAQARFLRALALDLDADAPPTNVLAKLRPAYLGRWLRQTTFRARLARLLGVADRRREIALRFAAARAADLLAGATGDGESLDGPRRRACVAIIALARSIGDVKPVHRRNGVVQADPLRTRGDGVEPPSRRRVKPCRASPGQRKGRSAPDPSPPSDDASGLAHPDVAPDLARHLLRNLNASQDRATAPTAPDAPD